MKQLFFIFFFLFTINCSKAQIKALTESGLEVTLFDNGTWKYSEDSTDSIPSKRDTLTTNKLEFSRTSGATFLVKSKVLNVGVYINPSKWTFTTHRDNEKNPEYRFSYKSGDGYTMMITEKTQIDLETMPEIALLNAQKAAADAKLISAEYRIVNKKKVLFLKINGTISGINFVYLGYYFSNPNGTVQLVSYTSKQFFASLQKEQENFLNGLTEINN